VKALIAPLIRDHLEYFMKTRLQHWLTTASLPAAVWLISGSSLATINGVSGDAILMAPPASVVPGAVQSDTKVIHSFVERENVVLLEDVEVELSPSGVLTILAGTCVETHLVHFDPEVPSVVSGGIHFQRPILGVLLTQVALDLTNTALGSEDTLYPTLQDCQVPPLTGDCALETVDQIDVQSQNVDVEFHASGPGDRVRVITEPDPAGCP
jgi:hypothetical protein